MLDLVRMDLTRMRKMTAFIALPIIIVAILFLEVFSASQIYSNGMKQSASIDAFKEFAELMPSNIFALFLVIFTVLFSCADYTSGFIKTISGQVSVRSKLVASKLVTLFVFELYFIAVCFTAFTLLSFVFFDTVTFGDAAGFFGYMAVQLIMHYCLMCFCAMVTLVARTTALGMVVALMTVLGFVDMIVALITHLINITFDTEFNFVKYLIMDNIIRVEYNTADIGEPLLICCVTAVIAIFLSVLSTEKRDVI